MFFPHIRGRLPISSAAATTAPDEIRTGMPSRRADARTVSNAIQCSTAVTPIQMAARMFDRECVVNPHHVDGDINLQLLRCKTTLWSVPRDVA